MSHPFLLRAFFLCMEVSCDIFPGMRAILLAGGFATRLWPLTEKTAKPLLRIAGKPILSYIVEALPPDIPIIISTNTVFADDFSQWKKDIRTNRDISIFCEDTTGEEKKKGALGAVSLVLDAFGAHDDILVLAGDNLFFFDFSAFLQRANSNPLLAAYDVRDTQKAKSFGVLVPKDERYVLEFQEKPEHPKSTLVSTGALYFPAHTLSGLQTYAKKHHDDLGGVFEYFIHHQQPVEYFSFSEAWFDIGCFSAFLEAQKYILRGKQMLSGATTRGRNTYRGSVFLAPGSIVENSTIENSIIETGATLRNATIRNSIIAKNATVIDAELTGVALREESFLKG